MTIPPLLVFLGICSTGLFLSVLPAYFVYVREKRLYKLAVARRDIATSVSEMQEILLDGTISCGHVCHDELFELMCFVQGADDYTIRLRLWKEPSQESKEFSARVESDLADGESNYAQALGKFTRAYYRAFKYKHPIISARTKLYLLFTGAFVKLILHTLRLTLKGMILLEEIEKEWRKLMEKEFRKLLLRETYTRVNPIHQEDYLADSTALAR